MIGDDEALDTPLLRARRLSVSRAARRMVLWFTSGWLQKIWAMPAASTPGCGHC